VAALQALVRELLAEVARLRAEDAELKVKLDAATRHRFGRRSERQKPAPVSTDPKPARRRDEHGRSVLPERLERRDVVHDLTDERRLCPACGRARECIGEQGAEQLDLDPPRFFVLRTRKRSYACRHCDGAAVPGEQRVATAGPSRAGPIAKGLCGPGLLAHAITAKFADHVPVHRLAGQLSRSGVAIARSTLGDWLARAADLLDPLVQLMHQRLLGSRVIHADDTPVKLRVAEQDRTTKAHLWAAIGDADYPYVVFDFTTNYTADGPRAFFGSYTGYLQADALAQYEQLYGPEKIRHVCCWAHARRKFVAAHEAGDGRASRALELIGKLYAIERALPPLLAPSDDPVAAEQRRLRENHRRGIRVRESEGVLSELRSWMDLTRSGALPKSPLGSAIGYTTNNWAALARYRDEGYLAIDNNLAERTLRAVAVGRNNWGVVGSEVGGRTAATLYGIVGTCKHLSIDPWAYLREALPGLFALGGDPSAGQLRDWLPDRWLLNRARDRPATNSSPLQSK
jgi:transposase